MTDLTGRTVLVTRAAEDAGEWSAAIEGRGGRPVVLPCIEAEPVSDEFTARRLRRALESAGFVAFTSRRAVLCAAELLGEPGLPDQVEIAAVGPNTAFAVQDVWHRRVAIVPPRNTAASLADELVIAYTSGRDLARRVVFPAADRANEIIGERLAALGVEVVRITVYRTVPAAERDPKQDLAKLGVDVVLLASPSAAEGLMHRAVVPRTTKVISIGPTTTEAARRLGLTVAAEARTPGIEGLLEAIPCP